MHSTTDLEKLPWLITEYNAALRSHGLDETIDGSMPAVEDELLNNYPPPPPTTALEHRPFLVHDQHGYIALWHLPGVISPRLQAIAQDAMAALKSAAPALVTHKYPMTEYHSGPNNRYPSGEIRLSLVVPSTDAVRSHHLPLRQQTFDPSSFSTRSWSLHNPSNICRP